MSTTYQFKALFETKRSPYKPELLFIAKKNMIQGLNLFCILKFKPDSNSISQDRVECIGIPTFEPQVDD